MAVASLDPPDNRVQRPQPSSRAASCPICRDRIDELEEEVRQLKALAFGTQLYAPKEWRLTGRETVLMRLLVSRDRVRAETFVDTVSEGAWDYDPEPKIFDVYICKLRKKLAPFGIAITTYWSMGCAIDEPLRSAARAAMEGGCPQVAEPLPPSSRAEPLTPKLLALFAEHPEGLTAGQVIEAIPGRPGIAALLGALVEDGELTRWKPAGLRGFIYYPVATKKRSAS